MKRQSESPEHTAWRIAVLTRDKWRCQFPGCVRKIPKDDWIQVHHIVRWADSPELRLSISNGIALCQRHHKEITGREDEFESLFRSIVDSKNIDFYKILIAKMKVDDEEV